MNCLYEALATVFLQARYQFVKPLPDDIGEAEQNLEACKFSLAGKERDLAKVCTTLAREAIQLRRQGDVVAAKARLQTRRRHAERLTKLRNSLALVERQLDALRSSELDKEVMSSLKQSTEAMKKAGIGVGTAEAEAVISQLDNAIRESSEMSTMLSVPLQVGAMSASNFDADDLDLDAELGLFGEDGSELPIPVETTLPSPQPHHAHLLPPVPASSMQSVGMGTRRPRSPSPGAKPELVPTVVRPTRASSARPVTQAVTTAGEQWAADW